MPSKELVVARYKEPLKWIKDVPDEVNISLYSKSRIRINPEILSLLNRTVRLPNLGREAHTYLTHIVNNYNRLSDITIFVQGDPKPHGFGLNWDKYLSVSTEGLDSAMKLWDVRKSNGCTNWNHIKRMGRWREFTASDITFKEWWVRYLNIPQPDKKTFRMTGGACFSVNKNYILSHSRKYYRKLLSTVSVSEDPEAGHFMERAWSYIFPPRDLTDTV